jgi:hypothetical protein
MDVDAMRGAGGVLGEVVLQRVDDELDGLGGADRVHRTLVEVKALGVHDHVDVGGVAEFAQFRRRELHLCRPAADEQVDVLRTVGFDAVIDVVRDLGDEQLIGGLGQHAGHVEGDIAGAKHRDRLGLERPFGVDVWVPVIPGHKIGGAIRTAQVDAGDLDPVVLVGTGRED